MQPGKRSDEIEKRCGREADAFRVLRSCAKRQGSSRIRIRASGF
jgi:hypothetical protein